MKIPIYQIDAFTDAVFAGNPAAVCPLTEWLPDDRMQAIAAENNLAETAFFVGGDGRYDLRWFTPTVEVDLCGHATLATAWLVFDRLDTGADRVAFMTRSGEMTVSRDGARLVLDFPALPGEPCDAPDDLVRGLGVRPIETLRASNYLAVLDDEDAVRALAPDVTALARLAPVIATAVGDEADFVSRFFAPAHGIAEDPVTGSAHCTLIPYWSRRLGRKTLRARQVSARGGTLYCEDRGERVAIGGDAAFYMEGTITL